jgi:hypothetical protein
MNKRFFLLILFASYAFAQDATFTRVQRGNRRFNAKTTRTAPTNDEAQRPMLPQPTNGDEQRYADKRASYGKILNQLSSGLVDPAAFAQLVFALNSNSQAAFDAIKLGTNPVQRKLVDPQAAFTYNLNGADGWIFSISAPPALASATYAGEMVEVYWMALLRDVAFNLYSTDATAASAIADLNNLSSFQGPTPVTAANLFRSNIQGTQTGPYISQFLYLPVPIGPASNTSGGYSGTPGIDFQAQVVPTSSTINDFMTTFNEWYLIQQGNQPTRTTTFTMNRLFIRDGRDLAQYVHDCYPIEPYLNAALILNNFGSAALDPANPYLNNPTQQGFVIYAFADISELVAVAAEYALRAAWYQKWLVHRRLRPEAGGFLVNQQKTGAQDFGLNSEVINSAALTMIQSTYGSYFLPQAFPEGSPAHPSYPQGHATVAGACATILKAFFNEDYVIPSPVQPDPTNTTLVAYTGSTLTVGGELNKLAFNTGVGRDHAGVHYRSDCEQGLYLGEQVAIAILQNESFTRNLPFNGYSLTKFDGTKIIIGAKKTVPTL